MDELAGSLSFLAILGFVAFLIWNREHSKRERRRQKLEERERLFDRIGSGDALTQFLQSEQGAKLLDQINQPESWNGRRGGLRMSVIGLLTAGVITMTLGGSFFYLAPMIEPDLIVPGAIIGSVGVGCIIAALIHFILGRAWGMLKSNGENGHSDGRTS